MTKTTKRVGLGISAALMTGLLAAGSFHAAGLVSSARTLAMGAGDTMTAVVQAAGQDNSGGQRPFGGRGGPGRFGGPGGPPMGPGGPAGIPFGRLGLSDVQKDQVKAIMQSHQSDLKGLADREMTAHQAQDAAVTADALDEGLIRARAADLAAAQVEMAVAQARIRSEVFQILTPDQQAQVKQMQADMKQRMEQRREKRQPPPPPR